MLELVPVLVLVLVLLLGGLSEQPAPNMTIPRLTARMKFLSMFDCLPGLIGKMGDRLLLLAYPPGFEFAGVEVWHTSVREA